MDIPPIMQVTFICSIGFLFELITSKARMIFLWICCASSRVGVSMSPMRQCGRCVISMCSLSASSSESMGALKAKVFPDPVCAATRKS